MLNSVMTDRVTIRTQDGKSYPDVPASVQAGLILTTRADIPIRPGDQVTRTTPAGVEEVFIVEDPGLQQRVHSLPAHYQMRVKRADVPQRSAVRTIYNITGPNARFNINSVDSSTNVVSQAPAELFEALRTQIQTRLGKPERDELLQRVASLEKNVGSKRNVSTRVRHRGLEFREQLEESGPGLAS